MADRKIGRAECEYQKQRYEMYREEIYQDHPQVRKFETSKKRWIGFLFLYGFVLTVVKIYVLREISGVPISVLVALVTSLTPILIFLLCALGPWKFALPLYILSALYFIPWIYPFVYGTITSLSAFVLATISGFSEYPIQTCVDVCSLLYGILILITAIRLTVLRKNRDLSDQSVKLNSQLKAACR